MRHQSDDIPRLVAEAGNSRRRPVRLGLVGNPTGPCGVPEDHLAVLFETRDDVGLGEVVAFAVCDRELQNLALPARRREWRVNLLYAQMHLLAAELESAIPQHCAGEQPGLEQDLKSVADSEHRTAAVREGLHF